MTLQFFLLLLLAALAAKNAFKGHFSLSVLLLAGVSVALAVVTLLYNQPGNFNIRPTPKTWGTLVTSGPYHWIRHPMYTSVLLGVSRLR